MTGWIVSSRRIAADQRKQGAIKKGRNRGPFFECQRDQDFSAAITSSSIFFASPKSMRLFSL